MNYMLEYHFLLLLLLSAIVGAYAQHKKRDSLKWFLISIIITPILSFIIIILLLKPLNEYEPNLITQIKNWIQKDKEFTRNQQQKLSQLTTEQKNERKKELLIMLLTQTLTFFGFFFITIDKLMGTLILIIGTIIFCILLFKFGKKWNQKLN
jgi:mannitol-specific phosphotransferase system IIBC component